MRWSFATLGMFLLGVIGVAVIILFQNLTTSNENDYYLLKEITEAAMYDSIDLSYYRNTGEVKIVKEKFVENFTRRYAESTLFIGTKYIISFYDIIEEPPKVSVIINTDIGNYRVYGAETDNDYNVYNNLTGIFEYVSSKTKSSSSKYNSSYDYEQMSDYLYKKNTKKITYYSSVTVNNDKTVGATQPINIPEELKQLKIKNHSLKIKKVTATPITDLGEILRAKLKREIDWKSAGYNSTDYYDYIDTSKIASTINNFNFNYHNCDYTINQQDGYAHVQKDPDMICGKGFWIHWKGKTNSGTEMYLKLEIEWEYEEYEYE